ncbi:beta-ketoacyl-[acyl-carrier-protein] synthase family protein [Sulfuritalea sp.]|uniref:beta-ketoacyl-[acyl-carrier-protein] synthase family protein n=1 Tax=Sulfuritalea sp. TaxID=2480090 RepID=UPI00286E12D7|nr:beta-ketoacyl-[acyl-carrier-protein] synthase family protein [Sulfuritalea sp.]
MNNRVFITGIGLLSGVGADFFSFSASMREGRSGIREISAFDADLLPARLGCEIPDFDTDSHFDRREAKRMDRCSQFAVVAARQAMRMAGVDADTFKPARVGVSLGTTLGGMINATRYYERKARTSRQYVTMLHDYPLYSAGARIIGEYGFGGPNIAFSTACSSSNVAIGYAADLIKHGRLDMVLTGGVDTMAKITVAGFNALKNVSKEAIRPFDKNRSGVILGEGAAIFCIESEASAMQRRAAPLAEILGYGMSTDAYHMTAPDATGRGPALAMLRALANAGIDADRIGYINAHGTGTRHNDETETRAIKKVFATSAETLPVSSTKSMHGHALGATGAIEAAAIVSAFHGKFVPPTINYETKDPRCDLDYVPNAARDHVFDYALSNNFGFGGNNCALVMKRA